MKTIVDLIRAILIITLIYFIFKKRPISSSNENNAKENNQILKEYKKTPLLTKYEYLAYQKLQEYALDHHLLICPKIRLADLITPVSTNNSEWQIRFNKIKAKHADFVICDNNMNVKLIIEIDDNSHRQIERQKRDKFVNTALTGAGYKIIHIRTIDSNTILAINEILFPKPKEDSDPITQLQ